LCRFIKTDGWQPVDTTLKVRDVSRVVEMFGGKRLYGNDPTIPIRELIQNAADAIRAKRIYVGISNDDYRIKVRLRKQKDPDKWWLDVEDNGIGMSANVMTQALLDFGGQFWTGSIVREEFPGLIGKGIDPSGKFGIGFSLYLCLEAM
jgi:HSP90 family molecular chaperone